MSVPALLQLLAVDHLAALMTMASAATTIAAGRAQAKLRAVSASGGVATFNCVAAVGGTGTAFNLFHSLVQTEELARPGAGGICASLMTHGIGLPPILAMVCNRGSGTATLPIFGSIVQNG